LALRDRSDGSNVAAGVDAGEQVDGRAEGPVDEERYGRNVGGGRRDRDESQERGSEITDPGIGTRTLERSEAHEGRYGSTVAIRAKRRR